jgi:hypothetical protein
MMGCYDFCAHYEWTFDWLEKEGGRALLREYWSEAISRDSQRHARDLIQRDGFAGMAKYWGHTLTEESPELGFSITRADEVFRIDIHDCPSKGFLLRNGLASCPDYCDHCLGWIGPMMRDAGFVIDHEHNHLGQCWWEMHPQKTDGGFTAPGAVAGINDVRLLPQWQPDGTKLDRYQKTTDPDDKLPHA